MNTPHPFESFAAAVSNCEGVNYDPTKEELLLLSHGVLSVDSDQGFTPEDLSVTDESGKTVGHYLISVIDETFREAESLLTA